MTNAKTETLNYDHVVIGAGIFGLYTAWRLGEKGQRVLVVEKAKEAFTKASLINQARIHGGYHYPRSMSTAKSTAEYRERFVKEYGFAVEEELKQIYAIAKNFTYTGKNEYEKFCAAAGIRLDEIDLKQYFNPTMIEAAYLTDEYVFDAPKMKDFLLQSIEETKMVDIYYETTVYETEETGQEYLITLEQAGGKTISVKTPSVFNVTYAGTNEVIEKFYQEPLSIKYEFAEMVLCSVPEALNNVGLTVMDGPFFSLMPYGSTGLHSLSAVSYTPQKVSSEPIDEEAMKKVTHFPEMNQLVKNFLQPELQVKYERSIYTTKAILTKTELDDARPTFMMEHQEQPRFTTVLSGKLNTVFDLDSLL